MEGGEYYHFGLAKGLLSRLKCLTLPADLYTLKLQFNIDGLPLFKSSKVQFWPILALVNCDYTRSPFIVGLFCGISKPKSVFEYLSTFVEDLEHLLTNGIVYGSKKLKVIVSSFVCDAPARAFVKHIKAHNGYSGCDKCCQVGEWKNKMTYPETNVKLRTDADFDAMLDDEHHLGQMPSPLSGIVKMVSMFPIDYMHVCCLGVTRKLLNFWTRGRSLATRLSTQSINEISTKLMMLSAHTPVEFNRKPRPLTEMDRWKASELRSFMLYTGPIVLRDSIPSELYDNFMLFSVGMCLLLTPGISDGMVDLAYKMLISFVRHFGELYGTNEIVFNIHQVIHLADEYKLFGPLDNVSGFPFENYLGQIKGLLRKPHLPLQQVVKRISEIPCVQMPVLFKDCILHGPHFDGPLPPLFSLAEQYRKVTTYKYALSTDEGNNCIQTGNEIAVVKVEEQVYVIYQNFRHKESYFSYPCMSSFIGCYKVWQLQENLGASRLAHIQNKCVLYPDKNGFIAMPMLHMK